MAPVANNSSDLAGDGLAAGMSLDGGMKDDMVYREVAGKTVLVPRFTMRDTAAARARVRKGITMAEVAKHDKRDDCWVCIDGKAYDVTSYVDRHPGGWLPIVNMAGKDCSDAFANYHPANVYKILLPSYYIGDIVDYKLSSFVKEHRAIRQELLKRGLFETKYSYYAKYFAWYATVFGSALYLTLGCSSYGAHMMGAVMLGLFWQQFAFFGHDIGHNAITHDRPRDLFWGIALCNTLGGISLGWWKRSHNVHHIVCNSIEADPDIQHLPAFAVHEGIFGKFYSTYHSKWFTTGWLERFLVSYQHWLFYPLMFIYARWNLYLQSYLLLLSSEKTPLKGLELVSLAGFAVWMTAMISTLPTGNERLAYILIAHAVSGLLHVQICLSHFALTAYNGRAYNNDDDEWFRLQLMTTQNIDCPEWMDWFHGGLQFQIEHHLWPRLPRHNLREARRLTKKLCKKHGVHYQEPGFIEANIDLVKHMYGMAQKAKELKLGDAGFYHSPMWDGVNAQG